MEISTSHEDHRTALRQSRTGTIDPPYSIHPSIYLLFSDNGSSLSISHAHTLSLPFSISLYLAGSTSGRSSITVACRSNMGREGGRCVYRLSCIQVRQTLVMALTVIMLFNIHITPSIHPPLQQHLYTLHITLLHSHLHIPLHSQSAEGVSVSCEPYDSAAVAVPAKSVRGTYVDTLQLILLKITLNRRLPFFHLCYDLQSHCSYLITPIYLVIYTAPPPSAFLADYNRSYSSRNNRRRDDGIL